jgi:EAL domain-containing protein (putative c-di-GMP-specific phosphodiesterase class I)
MLSASKFDPANLVLEITESVMMKDTAAVVQNLHALKALGLRITLDDFGTGYSSLAYLEQLPIDILKIDRSFVHALVEDEEKVGLAQAIITIAETLGHTTIAEGVENGPGGPPPPTRLPARSGLSPGHAPGLPGHRRDAAGPGCGLKPAATGP